MSTPVISDTADRNCRQESLNSLTDESADSGLPVSIDDATLKKNGVSWKLVDLRNDSNDTLDHGSSGVNSPTYCRTYYHPSPQISQPLNSINFTNHPGEPIKPLTVEVAPFRAPDGCGQHLPPPPPALLMSINENDCPCHSTEVPGCCNDGGRHYYYQQQHNIASSSMNGTQFFHHQNTNWSARPPPQQIQEQYIPNAHVTSYNEVSSFDACPRLPSSSSSYGNQETLVIRNPQGIEGQAFPSSQQPQMSLIRDDHKSGMKQPVAQVKPQLQQKQVFSTFLGSSPTKQGRVTPCDDGGAADRMSNSSRPQTPGSRVANSNNGDLSYQIVEVKNPVNMSSILPAHNLALMDRIKQNNFRQQQSHLATKENNNNGKSATAHSCQKYKEETQNLLKLPVKA